MMNQLFDKNMVLATIASFQTPYRKEHKVEDIYEAVSALPTAQPDYTMQCSFCDMSICTLKDRPCSRKVVKDNE